VQHVLEMVFADVSACGSFRSLCRHGAGGRPKKQIPGSAPVLPVAKGGWNVFSLGSRDYSLGSSNFPICNGTVESTVRTGHSPSRSVLFGDSDVGRDVEIDKNEAKNAGSCVRRQHTHEHADR
jgi:hypothetical protein